ncbi:MAG TPA: CARDB domain-containing protein, partial [Bryobacteraceae bacterium]|nr:CARDB domain-containing protein [Bryobacteraceae bacterium]
DLVATSFTAPVSGISGQEISGMRAIIKNQGNQRAGAFRIGFYLADRLPVTTSSRFTGWSCDVEALDPGQTFACFGNIGIPEGTAAGTYQLAVIADDRQTVQETAESNNARTNDSGQISVTPAAQADLVIAGFKAATTGTPGERISGMESTVRNTGNAKSGAFRIGFYVSRDAVITTDDLFTGWSCISEEGLAPGETWGCSGQIGIPNIAPGAYYLGAIVDDLSEIAERDENNNARSNENGVSTLVSAPRADLTVLSFSAAPVGSPGLNAPGMEAVISNLGAAPAGPFRIGFNISLDAAISTNDYFTGWSCRVESLDVSGTFRCSGDFGVPGDVPPGNYYFGVIVDDLDEVTEANEGNNGRPNQRGITAVR